MPRRRLLSRLSDSDTDPVIDEVTAVRDSLRLLLGSRAGAPAMPDYGVPELADLALDARGAAAALRRHLTDLIARHEPRLRGLDIRDLPSDDPLLLRFAVRGRITTPTGERNVQFATSVGLGARIHLREL